MRPTAAELRASYGRTVPDLLGPGVRLLVVGINPGLWSGTAAAPRRLVAWVKPPTRGAGPPALGHQRLWTSSAQPRMPTNWTCSPALSVIHPDQCPKHWSVWAVITPRSVRARQVRDPAQYSHRLFRPQPKRPRPIPEDSCSGARVHPTAAALRRPSDRVSLTSRVISRSVTAPSAISRRDHACTLVSRRAEHQTRAARHPRIRPPPAPHRTRPGRGWCRAPRSRERRRQPMAA